MADDRVCMDMRMSGSSAVTATASACSALFFTAATSRDSNAAHGRAASASACTSVPAALRALVRTPNSELCMSNRIWCTSRTTPTEGYTSNASTFSRFVSSSYAARMLHTHTHVHIS